MVQIDKIKSSIVTIMVDDEYMLEFPIFKCKNKKERLRYTKKLCRFLLNWEEDKCQPKEENSYGIYV